MSDRESVGILLPTVTWTDACGQMAAQLQDGDELLVICNTEEDPSRSTVHPTALRS
jgi:hypothetical protein